MAKRPLPDQATLLKLLRYDPVSGKLFWLPRTPEMFSHCAEPESICNQFNRNRAGQEAFTADNGKGYKVGGLLGRVERAHRVIWCMMFGYWPDHIDHKNQVRSDNRLRNLSDAGRVANARNIRLPLNNRSGQVGVHWNARKRRWRARISDGNRKVYLGAFESFEDAVAARKAAEKRLGYSPLHGRKRDRSEP
jgi:hypothetical protein